MTNFLYQLLLLTILVAPVSGQSQVNNEVVKSYAQEHNFSGTIIIQKDDAV